jgi:hypothetical protein
MRSSHSVVTVVVNHQRKRVHLSESRYGEIKNKYVMGNTEGEEREGSEDRQPALW